jgi:KDO2-lipid IV(A) lauroyltransferase
LINWLINAIAWIFNHLPRHWALALGRLIGIGLYLFFPYRKKVARANLRLALPQHTPGHRRGILFRTYQHFGMVLMDFIRIPTLNAEKLASMIHFDETYIREAREQGRGALLMSAHLGNWELIIPALVLHDYPITVVMVPQKGRGGAFVQAVRDSIGCPYISKKTPARTMLRLLKDGRFLGLAADQDARKRGVWVTLMGQPSSRPRGGAVFALQMGAPMLAGWCLLQKDYRYHLAFEPIHTNHLPKDRDQAIQILTQRYMDILGDTINKYPEQYFWFHRMWKTRPPNS